MHAWMRQGIEAESRYFIIIIIIITIYRSFIFWMNLSLAKLLILKDLNSWNSLCLFDILNRNKCILNENFMISSFNVNSDEFSRWAFSHPLSGVQWRFEVLIFSEILKVCTIWFPRNFPLKLVAIPTCAQKYRGALSLLNQTCGNIFLWDLILAKYKPKNYLNFFNLFCESGHFSHFIFINF